jgi:hypothetical protein
VSYDPVATLAAFAATHGITFPLLSDEASAVIRRLGLHNEQVQADHAAYGIAPNPRHVGLPYPGAFALDTAGIVVEKRFHESYRVRDTGAGLIARTLGVHAPAPAAVGAGVDGEPIRVRAWLDSPTYTWFQRLHLNVEIETRAGWHLYSRPAPPGMITLDVEVAPIPGLEIGPLDGPAPHRFTMVGLNETLWVHEGRVRVSRSLTFTAPPGAGEHRIAVTVTYQTCSDTACHPPSSHRIELPVTETALVGRTLPAAAAPAP